MTKSKKLTAPPQATATATAEPNGTTSKEGGASLFIKYLGHPRGVESFDYGRQSINFYGLSCKLGEKTEVPKDHKNFDLIKAKAQGNSHFEVLTS